MDGNTKLALEGINVCRRILDACEKEVQQNDQAELPPPDRDDGRREKGLNDN